MTIIFQRYITAVAPILLVGSSFLIAPPVSAAPAVGLFKVADFDTDIGVYPESGLTLSSDKILYGTTSGDNWINGGSDLGTIYSFNPSTGNPSTGRISKKANFTFDTGYHPYSALTLFIDGVGIDQKDIFYGTTMSGGGGLGTIYSFDPNTDQITKKAAFSSIGGGDPYSGLTLGSNNIFYGTTNDGSQSGKQWIYSFDPNNKDPNKNPLSYLAEFTDPEQVGWDPNGGLTLGSDGILYGTTLRGLFVDSNIESYGTIYSFNPINNLNLITTESVFQGGTNGYQPVSGLTLVTDKAGNDLFYGTTFFGGNSTRSGGTLFSFNPNTHSIAKLADINWGENPVGRLTLGIDNILYGTTKGGGTGGDGTLFSFNPQNNVLLKLADFNYSTNGSEPLGSLISLPFGRGQVFYGTTFKGGTAGVGTIFIAVPVPEPSSDLSLLAIGAVGAGVTLKRKLKTSKSAEKGIIR